MTEKDKEEAPYDIFWKAFDKLKILGMAIQGIQKDVDDLKEDEMIVLNGFFWEINSLFDDYANRMESEEETNDEKNLKGIEKFLECVKDGACRTVEAAIKHLKEHAIPLDGIIERAAQLKKKAEKTKASYLSYIDQLEAEGK
ncbi:MAG: hypothetical protein MUP68_11585 [Deltaproteobacteria bacterium]|nr:hypothetical protein [Deltaproteobacteria bacterium]